MTPVTNNEPQIQHTAHKNKVYEIKKGTKTEVFTYVCIGLDSYHMCYINDLLKTLSGTLFLYVAINIFCP